MRVNLSRLLPQLFLTGFALATYSYYRYIITKADTLNFTDLLWKVFITGLVTTLISLGIQGFFAFFSGTTLVENALTINFFYNILVGLVVVFTVSTLVVWKRLILYQKSKNLLRFWTFFESVLVLALLYDLFGWGSNAINFRVAVVVVSLFSLILIFNLKWIAYLNFRQKWKGILFILLSGVYLYHFLFNLVQFQASESLAIDLLDRVAIIGLFIFLVAYAIISILVTLFNLPTSSVFEQKLKEAIDFQKLTQANPAGDTKEKTYEILLDSSMSAVFADAAWLEFSQPEESQFAFRNLAQVQVDEIKKALIDTSLEEVVTFQYNKIGDAQTIRAIDTIKYAEFRSILVLPINVQGKQVAYIALLNEVSDAFNREMVSIMKTFVNQASVSLENLTLLKQSIENERYKEQLEVAKTVQKRLLPTSLVQNEHLKVEAFSIAADEVGGDYYDIVKCKEDSYALIVADVSGKGTSAAFQMAQMKGIFHSLSKLCFTPGEFNIKANDALSECLDKSSFITSTYFDINVKDKLIAFSRAGHCPSIYFDKKLGKSHFLKCEGMGLGILRNSSYSNYVQTNSFNYQTGDTLLLYTDGITEAKNKNDDQFGADRLKESFDKHVHGTTNFLKEQIKRDLLDFAESEEIDDDYTLVVVRFE
ncbi:MAG: GAF domain-containing SpoIIE family protein phosphatase [Bacteroidota bacterium]